MAEPPRCAWAGDDPLMRAYHDEEWGVPQHDRIRLFEKLSLEGAQAGLSWRTILAKRDGYRRCFAGFDPAKVARFRPARVETLMADPGIVRNRAKITSVLDNAKALLRLERELGEFGEYLWSFVDGRPIVNRRRRRRSAPRDDRSLGGIEQGPQAPGLPVRRPDHHVRAHAGDGHGERPHRRLLSLRRPGQTPGGKCAVTGSGAEGSRSSASRITSAMSETTTSSSLPSPFTPSSIIT